MNRQRSIAILGFGTEGRSVLQFLRSQSAYRAAKITILDHDTQLKTPREIKAILGPTYLQSLNTFELIFRSPGVPYELPELQAARRKDVQFSSATTLFFAHAQGTIIGITGTKGKGTTATLIYRMLKTAKKDVYLVGNIGNPALAILPKLDKKSFVVFELSSFQLHDLERSPHIAAVLDIFPDHMDAHNSFEEYLHAKSTIAQFQTRRDQVFFAAHNEYARRVAAHSKGKKIPVTTTDWTLFNEHDLQLKGTHNFKNAVMAARVAQSLGISNSIILKTVRAFKGLPYRLEIMHKGDVIFINDSAGTNPSTAAAAIRSFSEPLFFICGGKDKGVSWSPLVDAIKESSNIKGIFLIGENSNKIRDALQPVVPALRGQLSVVGDLQSAITGAYRMAKKISHAVILFSPASASFDMFKDYKDRGKQFKKIVQSL